MDPQGDDRTVETDQPDRPEEPDVAAGIGVGAYVGRPDEPRPDNDQDSHVSPPDNDGETVPQDEVDG